MKRTAVWGLCVASTVLASAGVAHAWPAKRPERVASARAQTPPAQAPAQQPTAPQTTRLEVLVLEGSDGAGGVAPELNSLPQLRRPPFSSYSQISVASRSTQTLGP